MAKISAFADEIDQDPKLQMDTLERCGVRYIELRAAWGTNVMKLSESQCRELKRMFDDRGFAVACIASPIGKVRIDEDYQRHFDEFRHAVDLANFFGCRFIRIFSYYPPEGHEITEFRDEVIRRLRQKAEYVAGRNVTLVLENEARIYGETPERCVELLEALAGETLKAAFDPANFVMCGCTPVYEQCWTPLRRYVGYFHIKDARVGAEDGPCVLAGTGHGDIERILADAAADGYDGFLAVSYTHLTLPTN